MSVKAIIDSELELDPIPFQVPKDFFVQPFPHQRKHIGQLLASLMDNHFVLDQTNTGDGKSFIITLVAYILGLPLMIICPPNAQATWRPLLDKYPYPHFMIGYDTLATKSIHQVSHGLLVKKVEISTESIPFSEQVPSEKRKKEVNGEEVYEWTHYECSDRMRRLLAAGIMIVADEAHIFRNDRNVYQAMVAIGHEMTRMGGHSRMALLSATLLCEEEHVWNIANVFGLFGPGVKHVRPNSQDISWVRDSMSLDHLRLSQHMTDTEILIHFLLKPHSHVAPTDPNILSINRISQVLFQVSPLNLVKVEGAYLKLRSALSDPKSGRQNDTMTPLKRIEACRIPTIISLIVSRFRKVPNVQIIVGANFDATIESVYHIVTAMGHNARLIRGNVSVKERSDVIDLFQRGEVRIIVMNIKAGSMGISLHDTVGDRPREMIGLSDYHMINLIQFTGRIHRVGTKSDANTIFAHSKVPYEISIPASMVRKVSYMREFLPSDDPRILPDDYNAMINDTVQYTVRGTFARNVITDRDTFNQAREEGKQQAANKKARR